MGKNSTESSNIPSPRTGLALSGGGFRATLFHLGTLWRLNEMAMLSKMTAISSVSGGSLIAGLLAIRWEKLRFKSGQAQNFEEEIANPILRLCETNIDVKSILLGFFTGSKTIERSYEKLLVGKATLQHLPDHPKFIFNACHLETGRNWIFTKEKIHTWRVGDLERPDTPLSKVLAASSAFPPFLPSVSLKIDPTLIKVSEYEDRSKELKLKERATLGDGGIYDNLGIHAIRDLENLLVSDGGGLLQVKLIPKWNLWSSRIMRPMLSTLEQTRALRRHYLMEQLLSGKKQGTLWTIRTDPKRYTAENTFEISSGWHEKMAHVRTRLNRFTKEEQCRLVNWGYIQSDLAIRTHFRKELEKPENLPFPQFDFSTQPAI